MVPLKYHTVSLFTTRSLASFAAFIKTHSSAASHVRYLWVAPRGMVLSDFYANRGEIWDSKGRDQHLAHFKAVLSACVNVVSLAIHGAVFPVDALAMSSPVDLVAIAPLWDHRRLSPALPSVKRVWITLFRSIEHSCSLGLFFAGFPNLEAVEEYLYDSEGGYEMTLQQAFAVSTLETYTFAARARDMEDMRIERINSRIRLRTLEPPAPQPWFDDWVERAGKHFWEEVLSV
jgi:hypothetical protein